MKRGQSNKGKDPDRVTAVEVVNLFLLWDVSIRNKLTVCSRVYLLEEVLSH